MAWRIGIDTGGTFTDVVAEDSESNREVLHKVHSTPDDPSRAVVNGILDTAHREGIALSDIALIVHGSTVATNAVLTRTGARVAVVTTRGFRDVLLIRRQARPELYNLRSRRPPSLVPRSHILEIDERVLYDGSVQTSIAADDIRDLITRVRALDVDAIVVGLLHSYANPDHEIELGRRLSKALPDVSLCLSHQITRSQGEFERFSTAVMNGYVQPIVRGYLGRLEEHLKNKAITAPVFVMKSNGGVAAASIVAERSVEMLLSGPAGGVVAGGALSQRQATPNIITADMGGTSFDVAIIRDGGSVFTQQRTFADQMIQLPMMDIHTIGAGGGSIGWVDAGGALRVGPHSAGADPGPACYGRGGAQPTVTDANLVLGRLAPHSAMAGGFELDPGAAGQAIESLATSLGLATHEAAEGIIRVVNANMTNAIRRMTVERGYDPGEFALCPFGGAGPLHAAELAREMGIGEVMVPTMPGVFSAAGLLLSELREEQVHSCIGLLSEMAPCLPAVFDELLEEPTKRLRGGFMRNAPIQITRRLQLRYLGQGHDLPVRVADGRPDRAVIERDFHAAHRQAYGYAFDGDAIEVVGAWVSAAIDLHEAIDPVWPQAKPGVTPASHRPVIFDGQAHETPVYERAALGSGFETRGPAIIEQPDTTIVVLPRQVFRVDPQGRIILHDDD